MENSHKDNILSIIELAVLDSISNDLEEIKEIYNLINHPQHYGWLKENKDKLITRSEIISALKLLHQKGYVMYYETENDEKGNPFLQKKEVPLSVVTNFEECFFEPTVEGRAIWEIMIDQYTQ